MGTFDGALGDFSEIDDFHACHDDYIDTTCYDPCRYCSAIYSEGIVIWRKLNIKKMFFLCIFC